MAVLSLFLETVARATVVLAAAGLVTAAMRRSSASARHLVWALGLVSALLVPAFSLTLPRWQVPIIKVEAAHTAAPQSLSNAHDGDRNRLSAPDAHTSARATLVDPDAPGAAPTRRAANTTLTRAIQSASTATILLIVWAAGASIVLGRVLLGLAAVYWMSRRTRAITDGPWLPLARALADDLGLGSVRFARSETASMPMAWGIVRGAVLMPADADGWPAHRLRVVLLHELAHVKRRDCLTHVVAQIVCAAYWFNPLVWVAARRLRSERERACDDLVLQAGTRGSDYADELLDIARVMQRQRFPVVLGGASLAMAHRSQLEGRLIAILDPKLPRRGPTRARTAAAATLFALLILSVASVQPWAEAPAATHASIADVSQATLDKPIESRPGQAQADVKAEARQESVRQTRIQDRTQEQIQGRIQTTVEKVENVVGDTVGAVTGGVVGGGGGVVEGVAGGVVGGVGRGVGFGIGNGVAHAIGHGVAVGSQATPTPTATGNPTASAQARDGKRNADPRAVAALMDALKDTDKEVRETAMHALVQLRDPRIFDPLVAALKDTSPDVREQAAFGLGQLRDARAVDALAAILHDANPNVREQAAFALGQIRDKRAVDPLIAALKDENADVREQAAFALGQIREPRAVEALVIALKDGNPSVREQSAFALGQLRDPRAVEGLTVALKDSNAEVRRQAAFALGQIRY